MSRPNEAVPDRKRVMCLYCAPLLNPDSKIEQCNIKIPGVVKVLTRFIRYLIPPYPVGLLPLEVLSRIRFFLLRSELTFEGE
jgi:hypothetical protein